MLPILHHMYPTHPDGSPSLWLLHIRLGDDSSYNSDDEIEDQIVQYINLTRDSFVKYFELKNSDFKLTTNEDLRLFDFPSIYDTNGINWRKKFISDDSYVEIYHQDIDCGDQHYMLPDAWNRIFIDQEDIKNQKLFHLLANAQKLNN